MKKIIDTILVFVAVVAVSLAIVNYFYPFFGGNENEVGGSNNEMDIAEQTLTTYVIPPKIAKALTTKEPEEFVKMETPMSGVSSNFCTSAEVDENGYLVLALNEKQKRDWADFAMELINDAKEVKDIEISSDYTKVTVKWSASADNSITSLYATIECLTMQLLNGKDPETLQVEYTVIDKYTDEILLHAIHPYDKTSYGTKDGKFHINERC